MARKILYGAIAVLLIILALAGRFFLSNTSFREKSKSLYIYSGRANRAEVLPAVSRLVKNPKSFDLIAGQMDTWTKLKPGKYEISKGMSLFEISRMLRNGKQSPVNLVITKLRTRENLASLVGKKFEIDSAAFIQFLNNNDSLEKYGLDTNTVMTSVFPNTYTYLWTSSPETIYKKLYAEYRKVWNKERKMKADSQQLSPASAYILASIIEEETNYNPEKGLMASVYINRLNKGINLGADPTVKFALRNFALKRIYTKHLAVESPYNTYRNKGLPPGPICTPSLATLDAVLNAPKTNYLFFVAKKDFSQGHVFTSTYQEHLRYAREYQQALNIQEKLRQKTAIEETGHD